MSLWQKGHHHDAWIGEAAGARDSEARPTDCDCGDTIRELLGEIAGTAAVFLLIILVVRVLG